jgi:hypothetical protein
LFFALRGNITIFSRIVVGLFVYSLHTFNMIKRDIFQGEISTTKASDIMTKNILAARASTTAREISIRLLIGNNTQ